MSAFQRLERKVLSPFSCLLMLPVAPQPSARASQLWTREPPAVKSTFRNVLRKVSVAPEGGSGILGETMEMLPGCQGRAGHSDCMQ